jgi:hypothetical protein
MVKPTDEFRGLMANAREVAFVVATELGKRGHRVRVVPNTVSPNVEERWSHTDEGDLEITQRVEVKHWPKIDFKSRDEVPYTDIIVDEAYKIDKKHQTPFYAYIIVNASMTGGLLIPIWSKAFWFKSTRHDRREGQSREFYLCPRKQTIWFPLLTNPKAEDEA